jgi:hypothetical protein
MVSLYLPLTTIIYAKQLLNKDTNMSAYFEEKYEFMLMTSVSPTKKSHSKMEVKGRLKWVACILLQVT